MVFLRLVNLVIIIIGVFGVVFMKLLIEFNIFLLGNCWLRIIVVIFFDWRRLSFDWIVLVGMILCLLSFRMLCILVWVLILFLMSRIFSEVDGIVVLVVRVDDI